MTTLEKMKTPEQTDTLERVKAAVLEAMSLEDREFTRETSLTGDLNADSLDLVEISMALEEAFGIDFGEDTLLLTTAGQIVDYIEAKTAHAETEIPYI